MRLLLNEQEIIDGICVYVSNKHYTDPSSVEVSELGVTENGNFYAEVHCKGHFHALNTEDIVNGIIQFLHEFYNFNPNVLDVKLKYEDEKGFSAGVISNE